MIRTLVVLMAVMAWAVAITSGYLLLNVKQGDPFEWEVFFGLVGGTAAAILLTMAAVGRARR